MCVVEARRGVTWRAGRGRSQTTQSVRVCVCVSCGPAIWEKAFGLFTALVYIRLYKFRK